MGAGDLSDIERPKLGNDIYQHPLRPQTGVVTDPKDGLPRVTSTVSMEDSKAPSLEPETFVCMGDESVFVIRDYWNEPMVRIDGARARLFVRDGANQWVAQLTGDEHKQAGSPGAYLGDDGCWYAVEPLRPQCEHYRRVMTDFEGQDQHKTVERVCSAQRTEGGEYVALGNTRIYACEHRSPRDFVSEERLRKFDADRVAEAKKSDEEWDGDAALAAIGENNG